MNARTAPRDGDPAGTNPGGPDPVPRWVGISRRRRAAAVLVMVALGLSAGGSTNDAPAAVVAAPAAPLTLGEVLDSVATRYPPYLAALIERDIAEGKLRSANGVYDPSAFARLFGSPVGYYRSATVDTGLEQFLGLWGATVFGGFRQTFGDVLPDYYNQRTQDGGEVRFGLRLPLLQDGSIDPRRAALLRGRLDRESAEPSIQRQYLDFGRAAAVAYYQWALAGRRLAVSEEILRVAQDRQEAIERQIERGMSAPIVSRENRQLVVSRELGVVRARRRFEAAALALSLLYRDERDRPVLAERDRLPASPAPPRPVEPDPEGSELMAAVGRRPEMRQLEIARERLGVDLRLARNAMLPRLDAGAEANRSLGDGPYSDREETEVKAGLEFRMPLRRSQARGALQETQGRLEQLERQLAFARDRIVVEIRNAHQAVVAAAEQVERAALNVQLADELQEVERDRFRLGAADLLALQIREQAAFQARMDELEALELSLAARVDLLTSMAFDLRSGTALPLGKASEPWTTAPAGPTTSTSQVP